MEIQILTSLKESQNARGITVVIDVLRAFTTTCYLFANGAKNVIAVADLDTAYALKKANPSHLLIGERKGVKPPDFDWGNSPAELRNISFNGKTIIFTTSAGTQGIHKAIHTEEVITGAFANAAAITRHIQIRKPAYVTLLCTDDWDPENEDVMCARYLESLLLDKPMNFLKIQTYMRTHPSAVGFLQNPITKWSRKDFELCMTRDTFDFIIKAKKGDEIILERIG